MICVLCRPVLHEAKQGLSPVTCWQHGLMLPRLLCHQAEAEDVRLHP